MTRFSGSTVLITGAASGIGRGLAHAAATRGAQLVLWDISAEGLEQVAAELESQDELTDSEANEERVAAPDPRRIPVSRDAPVDEATDDVGT